MPNGDDIAVARELGAITQHLGNIDGKLDELVTQAKITNGRVNQHDKDIAVLMDRESRFQALHDRVKNLEGRPRTYLLAGGTPIAAAIIGALLGHAF